MVYTRPVHSDPFADSSATDATTIIDALSDGLEAVETLKATLASPTFTGTPAAPTAAVATDTTQLATTAFVGLRSRVTHPNTDDVLVQVWDVANARWQVTHYDSGWRTVTCENAVWDTVAVFRLRRVGHSVSLIGRMTSTAGGAWTGKILTLASGFRSIDFLPVAMATYSASGTLYPASLDSGSVSTEMQVRTLSGVSATAPAGAGLLFHATWNTSDSLPGSLPGSLYSAAPAG